jgi:hypothetical protein
MRVKIQYSVDLEEIPNKISGFLKDICAQLDSVVEDIDREAAALDKGRVTAESAMFLDEARRRLGKIDMVLADSHSILSGYVVAVTPQQPEQALVGSSVEPPAGQPEVVDAIPEG